MHYSTQADGIDLPLAVKRNSPSGPLMLIDLTLTMYQTNTLPLSYVFLSWTKGGSYSK